MFGFKLFIIKIFYSFIIYQVVDRFGVGIGICLIQFVLKVSLLIDSYYGKQNVIGNGYQNGDSKLVIE